MINEWKATLSVNAGLSLRTQGLNIWIDALHDKKTREFSTLTPERQRLFFASPEFADPDVIIISHCHPDHYSRSLCRKAFEMYPDAIIAAPEEVYDRQILLRGDEMMLMINNRLLTFRRLIHEGERFAKVPHYGVMIEDDGDSILVLADCAILGFGLDGWMKNISVDTVFAPFTWITLASGRKFMLDVIRPSKLVIYHLPLQEDDVYGYTKAAQKAALRLQDKMNIRLLTEAFQTIEL